VACSRRSAAAPLPGVRCRLLPFCLLHSSIYILHSHGLLRLAISNIQRIQLLYLFRREQSLLVQNPDVLLRRRRMGAAEAQDEEEVEEGAGHGVKEGGGDAECASTVEYAV
jgi:hypothetical protein